MGSINEVTYLLNIGRRLLSYPFLRGGGGGKNKVNNYRPISLVPVISKLYEKIIHKRIYQFLQANNFLTDRQGGFRRNMGTHDSINRYLTYVYQSLNNKQNVLAIKYDLTKAFDTINHNVSLSKLEGQELGGCV